MKKSSVMIGAGVVALLQALRNGGYENAAELVGALSLGAILLVGGLLYRWDS